MNKTLFLGIDNGISGTVGVIGEKLDFFKTPTKSVLKYTKKKANITRIDIPKFREKLLEIIEGVEISDIIVGLERPMVNPTRFNASSSALRAWEATLILMEELGLPFIYIDSKEWQKALIPIGVKGSADLKKASRQVGDRMFPSFKDVKHGDRDGILIAEYLRLKYK